MKGGISMTREEEVRELINILIELDLVEFTNEKNPAITALEDHEDP